jgi:hypothetical protein
MFKQIRIRGWLASAAVILSVALPSVAQARLDNDGPWPGGGLCAQLHGGHIVQCHPRASHHHKHHH